MEADYKVVNSKSKKSANRVWIALVLLSLVCIGLLIAVIILALRPTQTTQSGQSNEQEQEQTLTVKQCVTREENIDLSEKENPSIFHDLTAKELQGLTTYLYSVKSLNLAEPFGAPINSSFVYLAELHLPKKSKALDYLDKNGQKPDREAIVTIFRGDKIQPEVQEIIVGPLPVPIKHILKRAVPFEYRPVNFPEVVGAFGYITESVHYFANDILFEIYGGKMKDCDNKCLKFKVFSPMSSGILGEKSRKQWFWLAHDVEHYALHPLDFGVLLKLDGQVFTIEKVWFNGNTFESLNEFVSSYRAGNLTARKMEFPTNSTFSMLTLREPSYPSKPLRNPVQIEPDGKRYAIKGRHVKYMNWEFDFRMSIISGPQLYDIRFKKERIVYELSLQEISVLYSANKEINRFNDLFDSYGLLGWSARPLVPGSDCPTHSTFIDGTHYREPSKYPIPVKRQFCVFEHNTGEPLRRHFSAYTDDGSFYEGMENVVLILRTIAVLGNYDYTINFIFYHTGAIQVKIVSMGYVLANQYSPNEEKYSFQIHDDINANLHVHLFNIKADIDIKGANNRYETLDISVDDVENRFNVNPNSRYFQTKFTRNVKSTEKEAAYKFNFETPKYHLFYNNQNKNKYGNPMAYRLLTTGMAKQLIPEGSGNEPSGSWARYQLAVTKLKDNETRSSSAYAMFDSIDPVVKFYEYLDDDESIIDQDLVAWVTLGTHHIPHTEDLPVTHSPGMDLSFYLLPYNYFPEDPSMASRNAIRIDLKDDKNIEAGLTIDRYGVPEGVQCVPKQSKIFEEMQKEPRTMIMV